MQRRLFDPAVFRIVLFDQRGCGRSTPRGLLAANDTAGLIRDIEQLRCQLGVDRWIVFGGSWGASLAIAYAAAHSACCRGVILRGTFLTGSRDLDWFFGGAGSLLPDAWQELVTTIGLPLTLGECEHAGHAVLQTLRQQLFSEDLAAAGRAARVWARWEDAVSRPGVVSAGPATPAASPASAPPAAAAGAAQAVMPDCASQALIDKYRVQSHYLEHQCFLGEDTLLELAAGLASLPVQLVHGRLDWVCRPTNAWQAHRAIPGSGLAWVDQGSHSPYDPPMLQALAVAMRRIQDSITR